MPHRLYRDALTTCVSRAAAKIGLNLLTDDADLLARHWGEPPLYADTLAGFDQLRRAGWKIGVLTNCDDDLFAETLARHPKLTSDMVVTAQQVGSYKPTRGHFLRVERQSGVARGNWVHAAASWFHDVEPLHRLGIARIWVDRDHTDHMTRQSLRGWSRTWRSCQPPLPLRWAELTSRRSSVETRLLPNSSRPQSLLTWQFHGREPSAQPRPDHNPKRGRSWPRPGDGMGQLRCGHR
jgi:FMN phosphatase YigB (HAD superfamily)